MHNYIFNIHIIYVFMHVLVIDSNRLLRIEIDTSFETVGNREIGGRDQREQLN